MNLTLKNTLVLIAFTVVLLATSCRQPHGDNPGSEYMPDMSHSVAYEANYYSYYYYNTWGSEEDYHKMVQPRLPVNGTIPRGYAGVHYAKDKAAYAKTDAAFNNNSVNVPMNGSVPYYYKDTEEERTRAMTEITANPFPITDKGLLDAKPLYDIYCGICHGEKGDGNGYIVRDDGGVYPAQPANLISDEFIAASSGRFYHAMMYGKNVMGGYADKLSYEERWQVIHYVRFLQAKEKKLVYSEQANTLNNIGVPGASVKPMAINEKPEEIHHAHDGTGNHSQDQGDESHEGGH